MNARYLLASLLAVATLLFAVGVLAERSASGEHSETPVAAAGEPADESSEEGEQLLGVDAESTPLIVLAVAAGLALSAAAASALGRRRGFLIAVVVIAAGWAALDVRELVHQLDESRDGIAAAALAVAALHLAAAVVAGRGVDSDIQANLK